MGNQRRIQLDRLDFGVGAAIVILLLAIAATIAIGDRAGVGVISLQPVGEAHTTMPIHVVFNEPMNAASVESRFTIQPPVVGKFTWNGPQLTFKPSTALAADQTYTVTIRAGAVSTRGRRVVDDIHWTFHVGRPRIIYLAPAVREERTEPPNLWIVDPAAPFVAKPLTTSTNGIIDFRPSPDGTQVAYADKTEDGGADLYAATVDSGAIQRLTNCVKALCQSPAWSPDGTRIAYERTELDKDLPQAEQNAPRTWVVSLKDLSTSPLFSEAQLLGQMPHWSPGGAQIAVYDRNLRGIAVYDLVNGDRKFIPTIVEETGAFDPTGALLAYPELQQSPSGFFNTFALADLANPQSGIRPLAGPDDPPVKDHQIAWNPDGKSLAITREYGDNQLNCQPQVYRLDPATGKTQPLVVDGNYIEGAIGWNPQGDQLVMQRYPCLDPEGQPGIWVYDTQSSALRQVAKNGFVPQWLP